MTRLRPLLTVAVLLAACSHTQNVDSTADQGKPSDEGAGSSKRTEPTQRAPTLPSHPQDLFVPGAVQEIQRALNQKGYEVALVNGQLDKSTTAALRQLQRKKGLAETGAPDRETLKALGLNPEKLYLKKEAGKTQPPER